MSDVERWEVPARRGRAALPVVLGVAAVIAVGLVARGPGWAPDPTIPVETAPTPMLPSADAAEDVSEPPVVHGGWEELDAAPLSPSTTQTGVWTGAELVVSTGSSTVAAYDPDEHAWRELPPSPVEPQQLVVAGRRVVSVGAREGRLQVAVLDLDDERPAWHPASSAPLPALASFAAVWTGDHLLLWGVTGTEHKASAAYDPAEDRWVLMPTGPMPGVHAVAGTWADGLFLIWGSARAANLPSGTGERSFAAAYDPFARSWRRLPSPPLQQPEEAAAAWTGSELVLWGRPPTGHDASAPVAGAAIDPWSGHGLSWRGIAEAPVLPQSSPADPMAATAAWNGREIIFAGGWIPGRVLAYRPQQDTWFVLPDGARPRLDPVAAWTGEELLVWGGFSPTGWDLALEAWRPNPPPPTVGCEPRPAEPGDGWTWAPQPFLVAPAAVKAVAMDDGIAVVAGSEHRPDHLLRVARYDTNTGWSCLPPAPIPTRTAPGLTWTGDELVVWGGYGRRGSAPDGAAWNPRTGMWRRLPSAPLEGRAPFAVVWTGREVLVWGGTGDGGDEVFTDGAAWDPVTNRWRVLAQGPVQLNQGAAVWTGTELVVHGSRLGSGNHAETDHAVGAAYDPALDHWRELPPFPLSPQATTAALTRHGVLVWDYLLDAALWDGEGWRALPRLPLQAMECYPDSAALPDGRVFASYCGQAALFHPGGSWQQVSPPDRAPASGVVAAGDRVHLVTGTGLLVMEPPG